MVGSIAFLLLFPALATPQDPPQQDGQPGPPVQLAQLPRTTIHGIVKNAATGEPLPRALVRIEGDALAGALTDGEGRFEIPNVPIGPEALQVVKPGFADPAAAGTAGPVIIVNGNTNSEHNVRIAAEMPDLAFTLTPTNAIRGHIDLSTGDPAQNISVMLLRRTVQDGRAVWQPATNVKTNSGGEYRFAGLADGTYAVYTEPAMDSDIPAGFVEAGSDQAVPRAGYPSLFYPASRDLAGAAKIQVSGGQQAQANLLLTEEPFHMVRASLTLPGAGNAPADGSQMNVTVAVLDAQGHQLPYSGQYDQATHSVQAFLPDGAYSLLVTSVGIPPVRFTERPAALISRVENAPVQRPMAGQGQVDFSVAGHAVTNLQIPLAPEQSNVLQLSLVRSGLRSGAGQGTNNQGQPSPLVIMLSQAGGSITDGMVSSYAEGYVPGPIETSANMSPGAYWVHTSIPQKSVCEASFTAGGVSLAREPLLLSLTGSSAPLTLTLRDDCATLRLSLPPTVETPETGEEPYYTIYVIPDFDSTVDVTPITLRPSSGGSYTLDGLTPGPYHVYTFAGPVELEYRNPEALAALRQPGQAVTLTPAGTSDLVVEAPQP